MHSWVPDLGNTADTPNPLGKLPWLKEIWESPRVKEFELTNSGLYLSMLYRVSYEARTVAGGDTITPTGVYFRQTI